MNQDQTFKRLGDMPLIEVLQAPGPATPKSWTPGSDTPRAKVLNAPPLRAEDSFGSFDLGRNPTMRAAFDQCQRVANGGAWCAFLAGSKGTGKTHLAIAAGNDFAGGVTFWKVPDFLDYLRRQQFEPGGVEPEIAELQTDIRPELTAEVAGPPVVIRAARQMIRLLILDDLGTESQTDWAFEKLYRILDARYDRQLPTIITTNVDEKRINDRLLSRYAEGLVVCTGVDIRRQR
jgi:DNA replication protein DnaC